MKDSLMKFIFGLIVLISPSTLRAEWNPQESLFDCIDPSAFQSLNDPNFLHLKKYIIEFLKDSWCSKEKINLLMDLTCLTHPQVCVEIGAFTGSSVLPVAATLRFQGNGKIFAIDAWSNEEAVKYLDDYDPNKSWWSKVNMVEAIQKFDQTIYSWHLNSYCTKIHESSENVVELLSEIDFLHLDGDYSEYGSCKDVELYLPKVKTAGSILLSNVFIMVNEDQHKLQYFYNLFNACKMICEIENSNAILFKKL